MTFDVMLWLSAPVMIITLSVALVAKHLYWRRTKNRDGIGSAVVIVIWLIGFVGLQFGFLTLEIARSFFRIGAWLGAVQYTVESLVWIERPAIISKVTKWIRS